jgi:integrase
MAYRPASYDAKNFCNRYWKPALAELGIDYRKPYNTRHTLISHGLEAGMNPVAIAALTGHDDRESYRSFWTVATVLCQSEIRSSQKRSTSNLKKRSANNSM